MSSSSAVTIEDWGKGISLSILASIIGGASKLAIRKSWLLELSRDGSDRTMNAAPRHYYYSCLPKFLRVMGMIGMTFLNPICCVLAMNYASPSILAPFSGLTLVWIVLFSNSVIGERPSRMQVMAAALIIIGEVVVAVFGDHTNDEGVTVQDVKESYREPAMILYFFGVAAWMVTMVYWIRHGKGFAKRFAWGVSGGSITGLQNFLKDTLTITKSGEPMPWFLPLMVLLAMATAFGGLLFLTACMKRYDATYSSAMFVGSFVVSASIMSAIHYETFENLTTMLNYVMYPLGLVILMAGVWILIHENKENGILEDIDDESEDHMYRRDPLVVNAINDTERGELT